MYYFLYNLLLLTGYVPISTANELYEADKLLIGYVQDPNSFEQFCENEGYKFSGTAKKYYDHLKEKMDEPLRLVYLLRLKWDCAKIGEKFTDQVEKNGCKMYRKYLDILYEYLFRMYAGMPAVKPKFYFDKTFAYSTMKETVVNLAIIWKFYFISKFAENKGHKLERLFKLYYMSKLFNEDELNYETNLDNPKETFQDKIVQMGLEIKWENGISESYVKLIRLNFDEFLKEMLINWGERYRCCLLVPSAFSVEMVNKIIGQHYQFNDFQTDTLKDVTLIAYLKGPSHFDEICRELENDGKAYQRLEVENKEELAQKYRFHLSLLYLMKSNWNCAKIIKQRIEGEKVRLECEKFGKYSNILYEYLFQIYAKTKLAKLADLGPAVKTIFQTKDTVIFENISLFNIIDVLLENSIKFFDVALYGDKIINASSYVYDLCLPDANKLVDYQADFCKRNESMRERFDTNFKTMLKEAIKEEKMFKRGTNELRKSPFYRSPFYDHVIRTEDKALIAFLKDKSKLKQFCMDQRGQLRPIFYRKLTDNATVEQKIEFLTQFFEAHLGVVYLMRKHWHCAKVSGKIKQNDQMKCEEYRKYLNIFSKYLFSVGAEDEDLVKAINSQLLIRKIEFFGTIIEAVRVFNRLSAYFFDPKFRQNNKLENIIKNWKISWISWRISIQEFERIFESVTKNEAIEAQMFKDERFDKKLEEMFNRAEENERKETEKLNSKKIKAEKEKTMKQEEMTEKIGLRKRKKGKKETMEEEEMTEKSAALADKFGTLLDSPEKSMEEETMKRAAFDDKFGTLLASPFYL